MRFNKCLDGFKQVLEGFQSRSTLQTRMQGETVFHDDVPKLCQLGGNEGRNGDLCRSTQP